MPSLFHVLAAEGGAADPTKVELLPFLTSIVVFGIFFFVLATKVWPKILGGLADRENKIRDEIRSAEEARAQATAALEEYEKSLAEARREASEMIASAKAGAQAAANELRDRNERDLAELKQRAARDIAAAKQAAISELHAEATTLAIAVASKILQREISTDDQQRLVDESLSELQAARN